MKKNYPNTEKNLQRKTWFLPLLLLLITGSGAFAQLVGWSNKDGIKITEHTGTQQLNYQVVLNINTAALIGAGKMQSGGEDIRFSKDCAGATLLNYFIETGINTTNTQIWVMLDTLKANGNYGLYMWYGNATATAATNFNNTFPLSSQLVVPSGTVTLTGVNNYSWFEIQTGAAVNVTPNSPLVINARRIIITGSLNGDGAGFLGGAPGTNGSGPGAGAVSTGNLGSFGAGGAGYGGSGGRGGGAGSATPANVGQPGLPYGTLNTDSIDMGSGGGGGATGGQGGAGGAAITLNGNIVDVSGMISANGSDGVQAVLNGSGGAGSGGGIRIKGNKVNISGIITANGGNGIDGGYGSGGGGGGRVKIYSDASIMNTGVISVSGGAAGAPNGETVMQQAGAIGTTFTGTFLSKVPTYSMLPHVILTSGNTTFCQGTATSFTASTGFNPYNFYVNATSAQNSNANTFSSSTLANNDKVKVLATDANGCADTSNVITVTVNPSPTVSINPTSAVYCQGGSAGLTASGASTYTWSPPAGLNTTSGAMVTSNATVTTQYTVMATDNNGCTDMDTVTVTVNNCTGINVNHQNAFTVYPNPFHNTLVLQGDLANVNMIELRNAIGEAVMSMNASLLVSKKEINVSALSPGIYFLVIGTDEGQQIKKIIKN